LDLNPSQFTIVHGLTLNDPPLSRAIGIALASDGTQTYFERGSPLPARRTFRHEVIETIVKGDAASVLRIPIVQGEFEKAHLCRLVGALEIHGSRLSANIPVGSFVEVTLEVDRGGRLTAQALTPSGQVFEEISRLRVPDAPPQTLDQEIRDARERLAALYAVVRHSATEDIAELGGLELNLHEAERDAAAARGGDVDAAQKARRSLLEIDAGLDRLEQQTRFPELEEQAVAELSRASYWVAAFGSPQDRRLLDEVAVALSQARQARQLTELQRRVQQVRQLGASAYYKDPQAWNREFSLAASRINSCRDLPLARKLVDEGREAVNRGDRETVSHCTQQLWALMPVSAETRQLGYGSGLR
jgi:molecular chaperone DnaK